MFHQLIATWFHWVDAWGYGGIVLLMAMESSIIPVPSEVVIPPAAFWAAQGKFSFWGVILAGTVGSYIGSAVSYLVARWLGIPILHKYGKYFFLPLEKQKQAELWVKKFGMAGIFFARLLPVIRHLISIPAGLFHMNFYKFSIVTTIGAGLWCWVLAWFGQKILGESPQLLDSPEEMVYVLKAKLIWFIAAMAGILVLYFFTLSMRKKLVPTQG